VPENYILISDTWLNLLLLFSKHLLRLNLKY